MPFRVLHILPCFCGKNYHKMNLRLQIFDLRFWWNVWIHKLPVINCLFAYMSDAETSSAWLVRWYSLSIFHCQFIRAFFQKVVPKQFGDFHKQFQVYARLFQHLIGIATVRIYCSSEPSDRPSLFPQLLPYHISNVKFLHKKCREQIFIFLVGLENLRKSIKNSRHWVASVSHPLISFLKFPVLPRKIVS